MLMIRCPADAERYDRELEEYEQRNPGYCAWAAACSKGRKARAALWPGAPASAPTARQLFVRSRVAEAEHAEPELADAEADARRTALRKVRHDCGAVSCWLMCPNHASRLSLTRV